MDQFFQSQKLLKKGKEAEFIEMVPNSIDPMTRNRYGWTLLMLAAFYGRSRSAKHLLKHGCHVGDASFGGFDAVTIAKSKGHLSLARYLSGVNRKN